MASPDSKSPSSKSPKSKSPSWLHYWKSHARADATAGLTVAVMGVPQGMAYAMIAGLPPVYGLYTAVISCTIAALLGSSSHLVTGPTNALCMVLLSLVDHIPAKYPGVTTLDAVLLLTFMTGVIQIAFGALRLGGVIRYVSHSVVIGFTAGAGILIALNQMKNFLGLDLTDAHAERFYEVVIATISRLPETNPYALGIGLVTAAIVIAAPKIHPRIPGALLGITVTGCVSWYFGWHEVGDAFKVDIVKDIQEIEGDLPSLTVPSLISSPNYELTRELGAGALALAVLGLIEAASIARAVAASSGQRLDFTREFIGQGASNAVGSFFSCFAASGSFTRTAVCYQSGGRTRMAATFSAAWTLFAVVALGPIANFIPKAALAGILVVIAYSMIDKSRLALTWRSGRSPRLVLVATFLSTLVLPLEYAIFVGVAMSVVILLRVTGRTDLTHLVPRDDSGFDEIPFNRAAPSGVVTINMEGDLYFAAAEDLDHELLQSLTDQTRVVVLRMKRLRAVGSSAMAMLEHFYQILHDRGVTLVVSGIEGKLETVLTQSGLRKQIGEQNIFYADNKLFQSTELALARAWSLVEHQRRQDTKSEDSPKEVEARGLTAVDVMSSRCIRFGNQHQLREAVWLMAGILEHTKSLSTEPLFLQDREAKLFGVLTPWALLEAMLGDVDPKDHQDDDDEVVAEVLRQHFTRTIDTIAERDLEHLEPTTPLSKLIELSAVDNVTVIPICDPHGRIKGLVSCDDLLRGLQRELALSNEGRSDD